jgi:hypothetical protein
MLIPKSKMPGVIKALQFVIDCAEDKFDPHRETGLEAAELETVKLMYDRAMLCQHGDGTGLDVEVNYNLSHRTKEVCRYCGGEIVNGTCFTC